MAAVVDLVFGHGKYQCLGKTVAFMELTKALVEVSWSCLTGVEWRGLPNAANLQASRHRWVNPDSSMYQPANILIMSALDVE
jgi:hypothetical protein